MASHYQQAQPEPRPELHQNTTSPLPSPLPLAGKRVLITRPPAQAPDLAALLEAAGAEVLTLSSIGIEPLEDARVLDAALQRLTQKHYHWAIFTSVNGVRAVDERLAHLGLHWGAFQNAQRAAIGPATAAALRQATGNSPDLVPEEYIAEAIAAGISDVQGQRILLLRADIAREALAVELRRKGAEVDEIAAYRTVVRPPDAEALARALAARLDVITFTSSSTVRGFVASLGQQDPAEVLGGALVACIGPITAQTAREAGLTPHIIAKTYTMPGVVQAVIDYYAAAHRG
jgi:uroporphyrinogen III methyltransferase/synthase